ncbi:hypothetical protein KC363_g183 [Hortaea werneckii]|nr:hypothetical protein KC363_g183 [Hortaea werneckii]
MLGRTSIPALAMATTKGLDPAPAPPSVTKTHSCPDESERDKSIVSQLSAGFVEVIASRRPGDNDQLGSENEGKDAIHERHPKGDEQPNASIKRDRLCGTGILPVSETKSTPAKCKSHRSRDVAVAIIRHRCSVYWQVCCDFCNCRDDGEQKKRHDYKSDQGESWATSRKGNHLCMSALQTALGSTILIFAGFCDLYSSILRDPLAAVGGGCSQLFGIVVIARNAHLVLVRRDRRLMFCQSPAIGSGMKAAAISPPSRFRPTHSTAQTRFARWLLPYCHWLRPHWNTFTIKLAGLVPCVFGQDNCVDGTIAHAYCRSEVI